MLVFKIFFANLFTLQNYCGNLYKLDVDIQKLPSNVYQCNTTENLCADCPSNMLKPFDI